MFTLSSPSFHDGDVIPRKFSQEGDNLSPALQWTSPPDGTEELVLICEDPDAPMTEPYVHWVVYGLNPALRKLPEGMPVRDLLSTPSLIVQGRNSAGGIGYVGPMPPVGHGWHHYEFRLYALSEKLDLKPGLKAKDLRRAMHRRTVGETVLVGLYRREREAVTEWEARP